MTVLGIVGGVIAAVIVVVLCIDMRDSRRARVEVDDVEEDERIDDFAAAMHKAASRVPLPRSEGSLCQARTITGRRCRRFPRKGSTLCCVHDQQGEPHQWARWT